MEKRVAFAKFLQKYEEVLLMMVSR